MSGSVKLPFLPEIVVDIPADTVPGLSTQALGACGKGTNEIQNVNPGLSIVSLPRSVNLYSFILL